MRQLLKTPYIPYGTQYYRAPSPYPEQWEKDLKNIAGHGFTMVKYWVQWRWNNPREGEYYFDDIDRLMGLARQNGLQVMLNTIFDVAPVWLYTKYPDVSMVTLDGRRIGPQVQPHRQIGGLGACFNHTQAMEHMFNFLRETVRRYKDHPALAIWNVGSEPELTSSMAEMRLYADDAGKIGDMLCYCDHCQQAFKGWLKEKYGHIEKLNVAWNRNYRSFEEIELPRTRNSFNDVIDWRMFFVDTLGKNVGRRFKVAQEEDAGRHPLMCHHVFIQGFPVTSTASDPWNVGRFGDLHAITQMDDPMMCDVLRSCAGGKPVISAEMLMLFGYTLDLPKPVDTNDVKRNVFTGIAADLKGFIFWQYRPEILAREAPAWGLTYLDGTETPWLRSFAEVGRVLQRNKDFLLDAHPPQAAVALLYNPENEVFGWAATGNEKNVTNSLLGVHRALYENNFIVDFLHPRTLTALLNKYKVVYIPFPYFLSEEICRALEAWVAEGGVLIGESYFGGWDVEQGRHQTTVPGYGLHKVFQAQQRLVAPAPATGEIEMTVTGKVPGVVVGEHVRGAIVQESFALEGAESLGFFSSGAPAITVARYGKGTAILVGSFIGLSYFRTGHRPNAALITGLVEYSAAVPRPQVTGARVRVDVLTSGNGEAIIIVRNLEDTATEASVSLPLKVRDHAVEQFSGETLQVTHADGRSSFWLTLQPREVRVYRA